MVYEWIRSSLECLKGAFSKKWVLRLSWLSNSFGSLEYAIIRYERLGTKGSFSILEVLGGSKVSKGFCGEIVSQLRASAMHAVVVILST